MPLSVGSRLGHYDVTALIGEGGMGQVYQATDTKLNRQVALKILPEAFATDPDHLAREAGPPSYDVVATVACRTRGDVAQRSGSRSASLVRPLHPAVQMVAGSGPRPSAKARSSARAPASIAGRP